MLNISEDPSLAGCLVYYLKKGNNMIGDSDKCEI
jgi:hypothetical protein